MLVERLEIDVVEGRDVEFEAALCEVRQRLFMSRGFRGFTVARGVRRPSTYLVQVLWETAQERADFEEAGLFPKAWAPVDLFLARALSSEWFEQCPSLSATSGPGVITDFSWMA